MRPWHRPTGRRPWRTTTSSGWQQPPTCSGGSTSSTKLSNTGEEVHVDRAVLGRQDAGRPDSGAARVRAGRAVGRVAEGDAYLAVAGGRDAAVRPGRGRFVARHREAAAATTAAAGSPGGRPIAGAAAAAETATPRPAIAGVFDLAPVAPIDATVAAEAESRRPVGRRVHVAGLVDVGVALGIPSRAADEIAAVLGAVVAFGATPLPLGAPEASATGMGLSVGPGAEDRFGARDRAATAATVATVVGTEGAAAAATAAGKQDDVALAGLLTGGAVGDRRLAVVADGVDAGDTFAEALRRDDRRGATGT
jgi:hypothetical protein